MTVERALTNPCVVFALRRESMYFRRIYPIRQRFLDAPCPAEFRGTGSSQVLMLETGVGFGAMEAALRWCLSGPCWGDLPYRPSLIFLVGFSGGLQSSQRVGDLVLANEVVDHHGNRWTTCHAALLSGREITLAPVLTVTEMVCDPHEKLRLGQQHDAFAVDMESAVAARLCYEHNVPFACLRAISDDCKTTLSPHLVELLRHGRASMPRLAATVLRHPSSIRELIRLAANTRKAAKQLLAVCSLLDSSAFRERDSNTNPAPHFRPLISDL